MPRSDSRLTWICQGHSNKLCHDAVRSPVMEPSTVHTTAQTTGWSVRMLHYLDASGLVSPPRSSGGYRLYGDREIAQLRRLRQLLVDHDLRPADLQVALRLRGDPALRHAVDDWLGTATAAASSPPHAGAHLDQESEHSTEPTAQISAHVATDLSTSWLRFEQDKHSRALDSAGRFSSHAIPSKETA